MRTSISLVDLFVVARRIPAAIRERIADRRFRKQVRQAPSKSLDQLGEHEVARFTGHVRPFERRLIEAPASGRLCVYYDVSIEALVDGNYAGPITSEQEAIDFVVEHDGHRAAVSPSCARISAGFDYISMHELETPHTFSDRERALLVRLGVDAHRQMLVSGVRIREAILEVDEHVTVVGGGVREPDPEAAPGGGYRESARTWLRLTGTERHPVFISDDPRSI